MAYGCGVSVKYSLDVCSKQAAQLWYALYELLGNLLSATGQRLMEYAAYIVNLM